MKTFALILGVLFLIGVARAVQMHLFARKAVRVRARIVDSIDVSVANHDPSSQSAPTLRHVVELPSQSGRKRRVALADAFGGSLAERLVGPDGTIAVIYDPRRPGIVRVDSRWTLYFVPAFLCAPGVLFLLLIAYVWIRT